MPIIGVDHVQLAMPAGEEERARWFYRDLLACRSSPSRRTWPSAAGAGSYPHRRIHLGADPQFHPATKAHPGLLVADLESMLRRFREHSWISPTTNRWRGLPASTSATRSATGWN